MSHRFECFGTYPCRFSRAFSRALRPEPADDGDGETKLLHTRSVLLSDEDLGAIARIDLIEGKGRSVIPIDYKHGRMPDVPGGAWEPERVQLCLQGLLLRANGYECTKGALYFVESKRRVEVLFDDALASRTVSLLSEIRQVAGSGQIPPPLVDSPKCPRCSLVGICLPDETNLLEVTVGRNSLDKNAIRRLIPARDDALPVYVQAQGATVGKSGDTLQIKVAGAVVQKARLLEVSHVAIFGNVQITSQALRELCDRNIPVCHFTYGGWFQGITTGMAHKNVELRTCQFSGSATPEVFLPIAREFVHGKIKNSRTLLRRNHREVPPATLAELNRLAAVALKAGGLDELLGIEGSAARAYFTEFQGMLKSDSIVFDFRGRNRRPPKDPVNAVLSFLYSMLIKSATVTALPVGFDPYKGFYHQPKYGKPALALDLAEEFRPLVADSVCIGLINNREVTEKDMIARGGAVALTASGRRKVIAAFERRMDTLVTHSLFGYSISYRRTIEVQARLLGRHLLGELPAYQAFRTR